MMGTSQYYKRNLQMMLEQGILLLLLSLFHLRPLGTQQLMLLTQDYYSVLLIFVVMDQPIGAPMMVRNMART